MGMNSSESHFSMRNFGKVFAYLEPMRNPFLLLFWVCVPILSGTAQLQRVVCDTIYRDNGTVPGYPEGYSTYRIYAELADSSDFITSVFAYDCHELFIGCENDVWQHPNGSDFGSEINPVLLSMEPLLIYDSYLTIGMSHSKELKGSVFKALSEPLDAFERFGQGQDLRIQDGAWGSINGNSNGLGRRVLLAQITTSRPLNYRLNIQLLQPGEEAVFYFARSFEDKTCAGMSEVEGRELGLVSGSNR